MAYLDELQACTHDTLCASNHQLYHGVQPPFLSRLLEKCPASDGTKSKHSSATKTNNHENHFFYFF